MKEIVVLSVVAFVATVLFLLALYLIVKAIICLFRKNVGSLGVGVGNILIGIPLFLITALVLMVVSVALDQAIGRKRILDADRKELLNACREMITNYDMYTNDKPFRIHKDDEKAIELWDWRKGREIEKNPPIPAAIKALHPRSISVGTNHVIIDPSVVKTRIIGCIEGAEYRDPAFGGITIQLTNGLYLQRW